MLLGLQPDFSKSSASLKNFWVSASASKSFGSEWCRRRFWRSVTSVCACFFWILVVSLRASMATLILDSWFDGLGN